jgi:predicted PurR-regulated permease PerM
MMGTTMAIDHPHGALDNPAGGLVRATRYPSVTVPSRPAVVAVTAGILLAVVLLAAARALPIFVVGLGLSYLIDPAVTALERRGMRRWLASIVLVVLMMLSLVAFALIVTNSVVSQGTTFVARAPFAF